jgi:hypothetical protein
MSGGLATSLRCWQRTTTRMTTTTRQRRGAPPIDQMMAAKSGNTCLETIRHVPMLPRWWWVCSGHAPTKGLFAANLRCGRFGSEENGMQLRTWVWSREFMCAVWRTCVEVEGVRGGEGMLFCWVFRLCVFPLIFFRVGVWTDNIF